MDSIKQRGPRPGTLEKFNIVHAAVLSGTTLSEACTANQLAPATYRIFLARQSKSNSSKPGRKLGSKNKPKNTLETIRPFVDLETASPIAESNGEAKIAIVFCTADQAKKLISG